MPLWLQTLWNTLILLFLSLKINNGTPIKSKGFASPISGTELDTPTTIQLLKKTLSLSILKYSSFK